jgi:hypothetical protein
MPEIMGPPFRSTQLKSKSWVNSKSWAKDGRFENTDVFAANTRKRSVNPAAEGRDLPAIPRIISGYRPGWSIVSWPAPDPAGQMAI